MPLRKKYFWDLKFFEKFPTAIKLEGGGVRTLMALSLRKYIFLRLPYVIEEMETIPDTDVIAHCGS